MYTPTHTLIQVGSTIFILFLTYFMIPASLRVAILLSISLTVIHLVVATSVAYQQSAEILGRQVKLMGGGDTQSEREAVNEFGSRERQIYMYLMVCFSQYCLLSTCQ